MGELLLLPRWLRQSLVVDTVVAFVVSLGTGLLQAATGIHETAVGLLPRLLVVGLTLVATLPWMLERMVDLFRAAVGGS